MTMQQWVNVMRKAGCKIKYELILGDLDYAAIDDKGSYAGFWHNRTNNGSIVINENPIMTWEIEK